MGCLCPDQFEPSNPKILKRLIFSMADLIAQGARSDHRWRREIPSVLSGFEPIIGRVEGDWQIPWDSLVSRQHVRLVPKDDERVEVIVLPQAKNPVFHQGIKRVRFTLVPGDHFVIGETTLMLAKRPGTRESSPSGDVTEHVFDQQRLTNKPYRDSDARIDMLSRLPDLVAGSETDDELLVRVTDVLMRATPGAMAVAIVALRKTAGSSISDSGNSFSKPNPHVDPDGVGDEDVHILHYDSRGPAESAPPISARLVRTAIKRRENILHSWPSQRESLAAFTASDEVDWSFCVPLVSDACPSWAIYVTGCHRSANASLTSESPFSGTGIRVADADTVEELEDDMKFTGLVATTLSSVRHAQQLQQRQSAMRQFFAPVVMRALAGRDTNEVLKPREVDLCVMFCDLRGFSRYSERDAERLLELLARVSDALGVMTHHILDTGGVIGDFHGDAAMGFWGWPLAQADAASRAADAALRIRSDYASRVVTELRCGIGIASGRGVAGQIGTVDQVKVTAFGPVVNLASRLEGLNKTFGTEILVDAATAKLLRAQLPTRKQEFSQAETPSLVQSGRLRRLAKVRPAGMQAVTEIYELRPDTPDDCAQLSDEHISQYEESWRLLVDSQWSEAYERLHALPAADRPKDVLLSLILKHNRVAPPHWDGVINFPLS